MNYTKILVGDFETTVFENQTHTEVWASALVELNTENVIILNSISDTLDYLQGLMCNCIVYYHNLKFDGSFWIDYLLKNGYTQAYDKIMVKDTEKIIWQKNKFMEKNSFKYSITDMGQWYTVTIKTNNNVIEIRDSLKLLPFSVKKIGDSFGTKHKKLNMEYSGYRYAGCEITKEEKEYIANDVLVVKEALEIMYEQGHNKLTIGSCCLQEFETIFKNTHEFNSDYEMHFPNLYNFQFSLYDEKLDKYINTTMNIGEWIRKSYRGGWCYLARGKENKIYNKGCTADVNSLYPSMMHSQSGNKFPIGLPTYWRGNYIPDIALQEDKYFFIHIKTRFYIKDNMLPFIQIKGSLLYKSTEMLETSDIYDKQSDSYVTHYVLNNEIKDTRVDLYLTMTDYYLILEHYRLVDFEIIDGCYFNSIIGLFDDYIDKYAQIKMTSKGAIRELAKLFLNNLYGKMASNTNSSFKVAELQEDGVIGYKSIFDDNKKPGYIPIGSAITSYARNFTIRTAQKNYYGVENRGFIYADTDSIHCDLDVNELQGVPIHDSNFCHWKIESEWEQGLFVRQKTYVEVIKDSDKVLYDLKCAGMPQKCKNLFISSITEDYKLNIDEYNKEEIEFLQTKRTLNDFKVGLKVPSKLLPKRIKGGVLLVSTTYEMR